jgi:cytochrome c
MKTFYKPFVLITIALVFSSCGDKKTKENLVEEVSQNPSFDQGKALFEGKGACLACHKPNQKVIGPSLAEISKIYKEQNASIVSFLKEEGKPIVDPSQYEIMKANFTITKSMSDEELKALETYILNY